MRYPKKQAVQDELDLEEHGRKSVVRPSVRLRVKGFIGRSPGPVVMGVAVLTKVISSKVDAALVPTKEYGRRWFHTRGGDAFCVVEELS
jgi:hypothetical protein